MAEDHLDRETSISAEITPTSIKASARSRFVAALDRLGGNVFDWLNVPIEANTRERRAVTDARVRVIEAVTTSAIERLNTDPDFAERALKAHLGSVLERQENKDAVIAKAVEDLNRQPPSEDEAVSGPETIDTSFMNRFERYAEEATTDVLREKWGRVLGAEIRKPGTFSVKVLRTVDELDAATARIFEDVCIVRLDHVIPKCLRPLEFREHVPLVGAGLIIEPGLGQVRIPQLLNDQGGMPLWIWRFGSLSIAAAAVSDMQKDFGDETILKYQNGKPTLPVYVLSDVGVAVSEILEDRSGSVIQQLAKLIGQASPRSIVRIYDTPEGSASSTRLLHEYAPSHSH